MRILAIETASEACSVALYEGSERVAHDHRILGRGHAESLIPMVAALPQNGRANRILVSLGPGSFTGVRIGIAAARALGLAWQAEVLGYPTMALIAARALRVQPGPVTICMNGGHGEWFVQDYPTEGSEGRSEGGSDNQTQAPARSLTPEQAKERGACRVIAGNRAEELAAIFADERIALTLLPDAGSVDLLKHEYLTTDLTPIYGRLPDATPHKSPGQKARLTS